MHVFSLQNAHWPLMGFVLTALVGAKMSRRDPQVAQMVALLAWGTLGSLAQWRRHEDGMRSVGMSNAEINHRYGTRLFWYS